MEENLKNRVILILVVTTLIFFVGTIGSCSNLGRLRQMRESEMAARMDLEERLNKFTQEKADINEELNALTQALEAEKTAHEATKEALLQEQSMTQSLKDELMKVGKLKDTLEEDLKDALVEDKPIKKR